MKQNGYCVRFQGTDKFETIYECVKAYSSRGAICKALLKINRKAQKMTSEQYKYYFGKGDK